MIEEEEEKQDLKRCTLPWYGMAITGYPDLPVFSPCCFLYERAETVPNIGDVDLDIIKNNELFKSTRLANSNDNEAINQINPNYCTSCIYYDSSNEIKSPDISQFVDDDLTQEQIDNYKLAKSEFESEKIHIESTPIFFNILQGTNCNLNCGMCYQRPLVKEDPSSAKDKISAEDVLKLKPYLRKALQITLVGGEPFVMKECLKLIKVLVEDPDFQTVRISLWSNATLIDKHLKMLKKHPKITLFTSPDSIGSTYEYIRRGAKWDKFESNVKAFQKMSKDNNLKWDVKTNNILMKSSIDRIEEYASWCVENNIEAYFSLLWSCLGQEEFCSQEDVIANPQLLDSVLNWDIKLKKAIEIFETASNQKVAVDMLTFYRDKINEAYINFKKQSKICYLLNNIESNLKKMGDQSHNKECGIDIDKIRMLLT